MRLRFFFVIGAGLWCLLPVAGQFPEDKATSYQDVIASNDTLVCPAHVMEITNDTLIVAFCNAMTHYEELCGKKIRLQYGSIKTSMAARPYFWSVFRQRDKRKYKVIVNNKHQSAQSRLIYAAPFDARIGVMGHELAHILDYTHKSGWQVAWTGIRYLSKKYRRTMEHQTDSVAIIRGFGWQLYRYAYFVIYEAAIDESYRNYKLDMYMKPEEIYDMIQRMEP